VGEHSTVSGQKTWTTLANWADWIFAPVCTDGNAAKKQRGVGFVLIKRKTPGITVRPIATLDGEPEINEVFVDGVKMPVENMVGDEPRPSTCPKCPISNEHSGRARVAISKERIRPQKRVVSETLSSGRSLCETLLSASARLRSR
jgi:alkylation response protein AidB-like acyl-CoA dehydrogenase